MLNNTILIENDEIQLGTLVRLWLDSDRSSQYPTLEKSQGAIYKGDSPLRVYSLVGIEDSYVPVSSLVLLYMATKRAQQQPPPTRQVKERIITPRVPAPRKNIVKRVMSLTKAPKKRGHKGLKVVADFERALSQLFRELQSQVNNSIDLADALKIYQMGFQTAVQKYYPEAWQAGRLSVSELPQLDDDAMALIALAGVEAQGYLQGFVDELTDEQPESLRGKKARFLMYAGGAWTLFNQGKIHGQPADSLWFWDGTLDKASCSICIEQVNRGAIPLSEITVLPGRDTICQTHCRHELIPVAGGEK